MSNAMRPKTQNTPARAIRLLGLGLCATALIGLGRAFPGDAEAAPVPTASASVQGELERRIDALENQVFALSVRLHVDEKNPQASPQGPGPDALTSSPSQEEPAELRSGELEREEEPGAESDLEIEEEEAEAESAARRDRALERGFSAEPVDEVWSEDARLAVTRAFETPALGGAALGRVECRSTLCRFEFEKSEAGEAGDFDLQLPILLAQQGLTRLAAASPSDSDSNQPGSSRSVYFAAREGHPLPRLSAQQ